MAKLLKITGYLVAEDSVNDCTLANTAKQVLASKFDCIEKPFMIESISLGEDLFYSDEWKNHPLNSINCSIETCESYFKSNINDILPCPMGTTVYEIYKLCEDADWDIDHHKIRLEDLCKIGKTVFLKLEDAEEEIARRA